MMDIEHIVMFSGGLCSFHAAHRVLQEVDREKVTLLFCDTNNEHEDLYRFIADAQRALNHPVTRIADGRTPWEVFHDEGMIGNTRADLCSRILKRDLGAAWLKENCGPNPTLYFGFDFTEQHRLDQQRKSRPWATCEAPLLSPPYLWKEQMEEAARAMGVEPSQSYKDGFTHDNCGGECIKAGHAHWARLLHLRPDRFANSEKNESEFRARTGKDVAILRDRSGGTTKPLTLAEFRRRIESDWQFDQDDEGGCNCFAPPEFEDAP